MKKLFRKNREGGRIRPPRRWRVIKVLLLIAGEGECELPVDRKGECTEKAGNLCIRPSVNIPAQLLRAVQLAVGWPGLLCGVCRPLSVPSCLQCALHTSLVYDPSRAQDFLPLSFFLLGLPTFNPRPRPSDTGRFTLAAARLRDRCVFLTANGGFILSNICGVTCRLREEEFCLQQQSAARADVVTRAPLHSGRNKEFSLA